MKLRSYLLGLALVTVLPLLVFSGVMVVSIFFDHVTSVKEGLVDTSGAISLAIDRKLLASIETLTAMGSSDALDSGEITKLRVQAERVLAAHDGWSRLAVLDPAGAALFELSKRSGPPLRAAEAEPALQAALATRAPAVSDLSSADGRPVVFVAVPVLRDDRVRYVLLAGLDTAGLSDILSGGTPAGQRALVIDRQKTIVASSARNDGLAGTPATPRLGRESAGAPSGVFTDESAGGRTEHVGYHRSPLSAWTVATSLPTALVNTPLWQRLGLLLAVGAGLIGLGLAGTWWFEWRIRAPIVALSDAAAALARGGPVPSVPASPIAEIDSLSRSIAHADRLLREREQGRRRAEVELAEQREQFRVTLASIGDGVIATDVSGRVTFMNDVARGLTGWNDEPAAGHPLDAVLAILDEETGEAIADPFARVMRDGAVTDPSRRTLLRSRAGLETPVECRAAPRRDAEGRTIGAVLVCRDASERRRAERERAEILQRTHAARDEAEAANRAKDELLAMLGHELRNPLGAISNALYVLDLVGPQTPPAVQARQVIARGLEQLTRMVDDLLDVARATRGTIALDRRPLDLADCVSQSLSALSSVGRTARHQITVDVEPAWIDGDPVRMRQIVTNLIVNAVKYTPADGAIHVTVGADGDRAVVRIADSGIGIAADMLPRVFEPFAQGDRTLERAPGGLGIGLTLARRLVEAHGGTIEAQSDGVGRGSAFTVRLPRIAPPSDVRDAAASDDAARRRILLVEDSQDARDMLRTYLAQMGHQVYEAADGPSAVDAALRVRPDVALVDIGLPGLDGYEVARRIRAIPEGRSLYLVAVTGYGQPKDREQAMTAGFDDYLVKPFDRDRLSAILAAARPV